MQIVRAKYENEIFYGDLQEIVKANFENQINNTDLTSVLYFLGIKH